MKLAVCLLTADRPEYTVETVLTYSERAHEDSHILLHADDGSTRRDNIQIAAAGGFDTIYATHERRGPMMALRVMWAKAASLGATHILHLENDNEFVAPLPRFDADCVRLYGEFKCKDPNDPRAPVGPHIMGTKERIEWSEEFTDVRRNRWFRALAHWGGMPSITRTDLLLRAICNAESFKDISMQLQRIDTLRPAANITFHIGNTRTPNAKFNQ